LEKVTSLSFLQALKSKANINGLLVWAQTDLSERAFSTFENNLYQIRKIASEELFANKDGFFT
jgi:hypothetical protein